MTSITQSLSTKTKVVALVVAAALAACAVVYATFMPKQAYADNSANYLTFTANEADSSVTINYAIGTIIYSTDGGTTWTDAAKTTPTVVNLAKAGDSVCLKGTNAHTQYSDHFAMSGSIAASGDVTSLINETGGDVALTTTSQFFCMFEDCTALTCAPNLPSTTICQGCYDEMFKGCTGLTEAPELPATTLAESCYQNMFSGCTGLTEAPALPATTLAERCYNYMFYGCTSLTEAPALPATSLPAHCYRYMFYGCTSLTAPVDLSHVTEMTLASYGGFAGQCECMYQGCTALKIYAASQDGYTKEWKATSATAPVPSPAASVWNYQMFDGCGASVTAEAGTTYYIKADAAPDVVSVEGSSWTIGSDGALTFKADYDFSKFQSVAVDGTVLDASKYTAKSGSTIVELSKAYLDTLSVGTHQITLNWTGAEPATASFTVAAGDGTDGTISATGDNTPFVLGGVALVAAAAGLVIASRKLGRKEF